MKEKEEMTKQEYQIIFNKLIKDISELLEVSGNDALVRIVKKKLFDFSDELTGERANDRFHK